VSDTKAGPTTPRHARRRRLPGEAGFTLNETLVAMTLAVILVGGLMTLIIASLHQQNASSSRSVAAREAEVGLAQLTRDLREAQYVTDANGADTTPVALSSSAGVATISFYLPAAGSPSVAGSQVIWTCTTGASCTRKLGGGTAVPWIRNVTAATFTGTSTTGASVTANPAYVSINVQAAITNLGDASGTATLPGTTNSIVLQDGVGLRNYS
jgi:Tfp pilus assembly protein PilW